MKLRLILLLISIIALPAGAMTAGSMASQNKGAENIKMEGGKRGNVPFPHWQHQAKLNDCQVCHTVFPQEAGSIEALKAERTPSATVVGRVAEKAGEVSVRLLG